MSEREVLENYNETIRGLVKSAKEHLVLLDKTVLGVRSISGQTRKDTKIINYLEWFETEDQSDSSLQIYDVKTREKWELNYNGVEQEGNVTYDIPERTNCNARPEQLVEQAISVINTIF